ncbi:MAG TPA: ATP-grasp domain-containing protein [Spirochaetales bacterium]|nr:ATP-grasp domain-containing protein [Spirochaetales bacterium]HQK35855.1 ATP-grasp domain-containing protein [Spirochaetales bacterium]
MPGNSANGNESMNYKKNMHQFVLVYSLKTSDPAYLYSFYASRRFFEEAQQVAINFSMCLAHEFVPENYVPEHTVLIMRGDFSGMYLTELSEKGFTIINAPEAHELCLDKYKTAAWFLRNAWPHPKTEIYSADNLFFPCILKPRYGKMGAGIFLLENPESITPLIEKALTNKEYLIQEYVTASFGRDIRFFFANFTEPYAIHYSDTVSAVCVMRKGTGLLSNTHQGGTMSLWNPPQSLAELAGKIFTASGLTYGTVDFLFVDEARDQFSVCELNSMPGFEALEQLCGCNAARAILSSCMQLV